MGAGHDVAGGQRTTCRSGFSPSTIWVLGTALRSKHLSEHLFLLSPNQLFFDLSVLTFILLLLIKTPHSVLAGRHKVTKRSPDAGKFQFCFPTIHAQKSLSELRNINCPHVLPYSLNTSIYHILLDRRPSFML